MTQDTDAITGAITELLNDPENGDDDSSIKTFYTALSLPYVERGIWRELEKRLRNRVTAEFVRDHYAVIVAIVEETL